MASKNDTVARSVILKPLLLCNDQLSPEWKVSTTADLRVYFSNQRTRSTHWFPPPEFWMSKLGLPYAWEAALDGENKTYYINHVTRTTTREDPRSEADQAAHPPMIPSQTRRIELVRDESIGFGFVAGSEKPVVIRSVIPNGPSHEKLFANDQILSVNGEDVRDRPQVDVINLIKDASTRIEMEVVATEDLKDARNQRDRKSSLVSRTSRQRRRSTPVSVRFADESALVQVIGPMEPVRRSSVPLIPNVLKVFLENGQTRSFRYDCNTTAKEIFISLASKLDLQLTEYFSLVLSGPKKGQISYIQNHEKISEIYTNRNCSCVNCLCKLNIAFMPKDHFELQSQDANVFEYLYSQVTNRVVEGFYGMDLKYDLAIKLAALQIQQKTVEAAAGRPVKVTVRQAQREFGGLGKFVPSDLLHSMRGKDLRKALEQQIKQNENLISPDEKHMSSLQCKLHYLNLAMELFSYGGRYFDVVLLDNDNDGPCLKRSWTSILVTKTFAITDKKSISQTRQIFSSGKISEILLPWKGNDNQTMNQHAHVTLLVNLKYGISHVVRGKVNVLCQLAEFCDVTGFTISRQEDEKKLLCIRLQDGKTIQVICSLIDCVDIIALITGYYKVYVDNTSETPLPVENDERWPFSFRRDPRASDAPDFYSMHQVIPDVWSYPSFYKVSNLKKTQLDTNSVNRRKDVFIDLSRAPPRFLENVISEESREEAGEGVFGIDRREDMHEFSNEKFDSLENLTFQSKKDDVKQASSFLKISTEEADGVSNNIHVDDAATEATGYISEELRTSVNSLNQNMTPESSQEEELGVQSSYNTSNEFLHHGPRDLLSPNLPPDAFWQIKESNCSTADKNKLEEAPPKQETFKSEFRDEDERNLNVSVGPEGPKDLTIDVVGDGGNTDFLLERFSHNSSGDEFRELNLKKQKEAAEYDNCTEASGSPDTAKVSAYDPRKVFLLEHELDDNQQTNPEPQAGPQFHHEEDPVMGKDRKPASDNVEVDDSICDHKTVPLVPDDVEIEMVLKDYDDQNGEPYFTEFSGHLAKRDSLKNSSNDELLPLQFEELDCDALQDSFDSTNPEVNDCDSSTNRNSPNEMLQNGYSRLVNDSPSPSNDSDNSTAIVGSVIGSLEFDDSTNTDEGPEKSDEDEPLWSTFPEYFQPSKRSQDSDSIENVLLLADESDSETDQGFERVKGHELEELFIAPSQNFQFTYKVNTEFARKDKMTGDHDSCQGTKEKNLGRSLEFEGDIDELNQVHALPPSPNFSSNCLPDITLHHPLSCAVEPTALTESNITSSPCYSSYFCEDSSQATEREKPNEEQTDKESLILSNGMSGKLIPSTVVLVECSSLENERITSKQFQSLNNRWREIHTTPNCNKSYSPTDWIIPSPATQTPELQKHDIRIVSPPPSMKPCVDNEFEDELTQWIIPAPPSTVDSIQLLSEIKVVSPPPTLQTSHNGIELPLCNLDEFGFLSLTNDHKLAQSNDQRSNSNATEDHKIQAKTIPNDASWASKEYEPQTKKHFIPGTYESYHLDKESCPQKIERSTITEDFFLRTDNLSPLRGQHDQLTLADDSFGTRDLSSPNFYDIDCSKNENVNSSYIFESIPEDDHTMQHDSRMKSDSKALTSYKPPIPPKPWFLRRTRSGGKEKTEGAILGSNDISRCRHLKRSNSDILSSRVVRTAEQDSYLDINLNRVWEAIGQKSTTDKTFGIAEQKSSAGLKECQIKKPGVNKEQWHSPPYSSKDFVSKQEAKTPYDIEKLGRSLSFTYRSPHIPVLHPANCSPTQSLQETQPFFRKDHKGHFPKKCIDSLGSPRTDSMSPCMQHTPITAPVNGSCVLIDSEYNNYSEELNVPGKTLREKGPMASWGLDSCEDQPSNLCNDCINGTPQEPSSKTSNSQVCTEALTFNTDDKDFNIALTVPIDDACQMASPSLTSSAISKNSTPPPPMASPPESVSRFDDDEFSILETIPDNSHYDTSIRHHERSTSVTLLSSRELRGRKSSSFCQDNFDDLTKRNPSHVIDNFADKYLGKKCQDICENILLKVGKLKKRLEAHLENKELQVDLKGNIKTWRSVLRNNSKFLACDIKFITASTQQGLAQLIAAVRASANSLEMLVESCMKTSVEQSKSSSQNVHFKIMEIVEHYADCINTVKSGTVERPDFSAFKSLKDKTNALSALITTLIQLL